MEDKVEFRCLTPSWTRKLSLSPDKKLPSKEKSQLSSEKSRLKAAAFSPAVKSRILAYPGLPSSSPGSSTPSAKSTKDPQRKPEAEDPTAELAKQKQENLKLKEQLHLVMQIKSELEVAGKLAADEATHDLKLQVKHLLDKLIRESRARREAERQLNCKEKELQALRAAASASQTEAAQLEGELLEAAQDVLQTQKLQTKLQAVSLREAEARQVAELHKQECEELRARLSQAESSRLARERELHELRGEARHWESHLDELQDHLDRVLAGRFGSQPAQPEVPTPGAIQVA